MTPDEFTNRELMLDVGDGHKLYVQDWGRKDAATPIIFLHGGPGSGCNDGHKGYFVPGKHRVIFFDQRGAGKSKPYGSLDHNTTNDIINDINKILDNFGVERVILCGRSWGSSLALVYGIRNPEKVAAIVTGGVFFADNQAEQQINERAEVSKLLYPDVWSNIESDNTTENELMKAVLSEDEQASKKSAYKLSKLFAQTFRLDDRSRPIDYEAFDPTSLKIEAHYKANDWFLPAGYILNNLGKLTMPVWIVQGRHDMATLPIYAWQLHQKLPDSHLIWTVGGHSGNDRENWLATKTILENLPCGK